MLYVMIAVAGWMVWGVAGFEGAVGPFVLYTLQLTLNGCWTVLFFGLQRPDLAQLIS